MTSILLHSERNLALYKRTREISTIFQGTPSIYSWVYHTKGSQSSDNFAIYITFTCAEQQHNKCHILSALCYLFSIFHQGHLVINHSSEHNWDLKWHCKTYNSGMKVLIEKHTPLRKKVINVRANEELAKEFSM